MILIHVLPRDLGEFFDIVSPAVEVWMSDIHGQFLYHCLISYIPLLSTITSCVSVLQGLHLPVDVRQVLLQQVFDNANLKDPEVLVWLGQRLHPLLPNLTDEHVAPLFNIVRHRDCNISQKM